MFSFSDSDNLSRRCVWVNGPVIVGAGPSGLAVAAELKQQGVPFVILDRADCIASLWQKRTYDRLKLHLPKKFCQLPRFPLPDDYPEHLSKRQFIEYLECYTSHFDIRPQLNQCVESAKYDEACRLWRVKTVSTEYICQSLVVATGENAEPVVPAVEGLKDFGGEVIHACDYKSGHKFRGKEVLVVGCGNSGMEVSLDLFKHGAKPSMVVPSSVNVLPGEVFPWMILGNMEKYGAGPIEVENSHTTVVDIEALEKIRSKEIQQVHAIKRFSSGMVELANGEKLEINSVVFATGYRSNVPYWLQENELFAKNGLPKTAFPNGWKGKDGLYAVGFTGRGLPAASVDAIKISQDIAKAWKDGLKQKKYRIKNRKSAFIKSM